MAEKSPLPDVKPLMAEGLSAGGYLRGSENWETYHGGERLRLRDAKVDEERHGVVVVGTELGHTLLMAATLNNLPNVIIIGDRLADGVDLGKVRAERLRHTAHAKTGESYWAVYVVESSTLVSLGTPHSSSRLIADILRAQLGHTFEQRKVCAECGQLNPYRGQYCTRCGNRLLATGRLNRWIHYDDEETVRHKLTPEEKAQVEQAEPSKGGFITPLLSWRERTLKRKIESDDKKELDQASPDPTIPSKKPSLLPDALRKRTEEKKSVVEEVPPETKKIVFTKKAYDTKVVRTKKDAYDTNIVRTRKKP